LCRRVLERSLNLKLDKQKPKWLKGLELDGYNSASKIAFEHHGKQHYQFVSHLHATKSIFSDQQKRDKLKIKRCINEKVKLIVIPELFTITKNLSLLLIEEFKRLNITKFKKPELLDPDFDAVYLDNTMGELADYIKNRGGELLDTIFKGKKFKYKYSCGNGHTNMMIFDSISRNSWCPDCSQNKKLNLVEIKKRCKKHDLVYVSGYSKYQNTSSVLKVKCLLCGEFSLKKVSNISCSRCAHCSKKRMWDTIRQK
jgi:hypothetical protein